MNLHPFLDFNQNCPVCGKHLTLYMQILDGALWSSERQDVGIYRFNQFKIKDESLAHGAHFWLDNLTENCNIDFGGFGPDEAYQKSKDWKLFFFFICNTGAFEDASGQEYAINPYLACYYRSSPILELKQISDKKCEFVLSDSIPPTGAVEGCIRDEIFIFKTNRNNGNEKVYILNSDYENKNTVLRYYSVSPEDRKNRDFDPNIFKKDMPLINVRPNFDLDSRDKLISRFDSWILMS